MIGMTSSSSLPSLYEKEFLELVLENGQIVERGGSSSNGTNQNGSITGRTTRLSNSLLDEFSPHTHNKDSDLNMSSSHQSSDQHSCKIDLHFSQSKNSSSAKESKITGNNNNRLFTYSTSQQCLLSPSSSPLKKPRVDYYSSSQPPPPPATLSKSKTQYLGFDNNNNQRTTRKVNFSNFLIPALSLRSFHHQENISARVGEINEAVKVEKTPAAAAAASSKFHEGVGCSNNSALRTQGSNHVPHYNEIPSSAASKAKGIANNSNNYYYTESCNEPLLASSSVCSLEASNDPNIGVWKNVHEHTTDDSTYLSDNDEETEDVTKDTPPRDLIRTKRGKSSEIHNLSERKRRDNINKKIRTLKELIPNCNKMDKAATLDDAIDYLKTLKLQLQIMSMGSGLCNPLMMLPAAVNASPHLPHQLMGPTGMCFRPGAGPGFPCSPPTPTQFPIPLPLPAITDTTLLANMFGFSNHMRLMSPIPHHAPFIPNINGMKPPTPSQLMAATTTPTNLVGNLANSATAEDLHGNAEYAAAAAAMQATNDQVSLHHTSGYPFQFPTGKEEK